MRSPTWGSWRASQDWSGTTSPGHGERGAQTGSLIAMRLKGRQLPCACLPAKLLGGVPLSCHGVAVRGV